MAKKMRSKPASHRDRKSEHFVPRDADNRKGQAPEGAEIPGPPYRINPEALSFCSTLIDAPYIDVLSAVDFLATKIKDPNFHLEPICRGCELWTPSLMKPVRKGAVNNLEGCSGCLYSMLDGEEGGNWGNPARDKAFSAWAEAKGEVTRLELLRAEAKGEVAKERLQTRIVRAYSRLSTAVVKCQKLGFSPSAPMRPAEPFLRPLHRETRDFRRKRDLLAGLTSGEETEKPNCSNCWAWDPDPGLSKSEKKRVGRCSVRDGETTAEKFWCHEHSQSG